MPATDEKDEKTTKGKAKDDTEIREAKEAKEDTDEEPEGDWVEKYGKIDSRWAAVRDPRIAHVLEYSEFPEVDEDAPADAIPPAPTIIYVIANPDGKMEELDAEEYAERGYANVPPSKM